VIASRSAEELARLVKGIKANGGEAMAVVMDVADAASVETLVKRAVEAYGRLDLAVALPHQKSSPAACSTGYQELLARFSADETGEGIGPWMTSACHCSSTVSRR